VKGMTEKARAGMYPSCAPVGYRNDGAGGKRVIISDPDAAPVISELFERFARENCRSQLLPSSPERSSLGIVVSSILLRSLVPDLHTGLNPFGDSQAIQQQYRRR